MPLAIVRDDLVNRREDAIVLPSNERLDISGGSGMEVAKAAGLRRVQRACRKIGGCAVGDAVATPAFSLPARFLIHAVGPVWAGTASDEELLRRAYRSALERALDLGCASVAVPLLSAGTNGCPAHVSLAVALDEAQGILDWADLQITVVLFDKAAVANALEFIGEIEQRIDDAYVEQHHRAMLSDEYRNYPPSFDASLPIGGIYPRPAAPTAAPSVLPSIMPTTAPAPSGKPKRFGRFRRQQKEQPDTTGAMPPAEHKQATGAMPPAEHKRATGAMPPARHREVVESAPLPESDEAFAPAAMPPARSREVVEPAPLPESDEAFAPAAAPAPSPAMDSFQMGAPARTDSLESRLHALDASFSQKLLGLIDDRGFTDSQVYRRANMTRQHFSKIRNNVGYRPTKATVLALCVALELDLAETTDLLERAGFALTHASKFDIILEYFIERGDYDTFRINETLFYFDQPLLG